MKITTIVEYSEEDKKLLKKPLPDNPCVGCYLNGNGCCGCPDGTKYSEAVKPYREAEIYDIALDIKKKETLELQLHEIVKEINEINKKLPDFVAGKEVEVVLR